MVSGARNHVKLLRIIIYVSILKYQAEPFLECRTSLRWKIGAAVPGLLKLCLRTGYQCSKESVNEIISGSQSVAHVLRKTHMVRAALSNLSLVSELFHSFRDDANWQTRGTTTVS